MEKIKGYLRYFVCVALLLAVLAAYGLRLADWQLIKGAAFLEQAERSTTAKVPMEAPRGEILDKDGSGLAVNKTGYALIFERADMKSETENQTIAQLISLMNRRGEKWTDALPVTVDQNGKYRFKSGEEKEIATLKSKDHADLNSYATADECMAALIKKYEVSGFSPADTRAVVSVRYNMSKTGFSLSMPYTFAPDVSRDVVAAVSENSAKLPGVSVKVTTARSYPDGSLLPHILGRVGLLSAEEYKVLKDRGYAFNDHVGKDGIEEYMESRLRGTDGEKVLETPPSGTGTVETVSKQPNFGDTVYLTINSNLQKVLNVSLMQNVKATAANGRALSAAHYKGLSYGHGEECVAGAAVVLRVSDFAVLAAATYPGYDMNKYQSDSNYARAVNADQKTKPLVNRAFNGIFTPGSVVKPYVALTALQEGAITTSTRILGNRKYMRFADVGFTPESIGSYGMITLNYAIKKSSNSFFYEVGYRTGITNLNLYAKHFGFGVKTGIELNESQGVLAGPAERKNQGGGWWDGDTVQAAVGQSDNQFTPVQLATYVATIANNGTRLKPHLIDKVTDYSRKTVLSQTKAQAVDSIGVNQNYIDYVKAAMRSVTETGGTAASAFESYGIAIAGKTGTAVRDPGTDTSKNPGSDNVLFVGFAPYEKPEIAVAVVLEFGETSKYSNAVAKDAFDAYFYGKTVDANGNLVMPSASNAAGNSSSASSAARTG